MKLRIFFGIAILGVLIISALNSCQKKTDCKLVVKTVDSTGVALSNVEVKLYANVKTASGATVEADLKAQGVSDGTGISNYTFKLPAIIDIKAVLGNRSGVGIVKLEEGKTVEKTITVK